MQSSTKAKLIEKLNEWLNDEKVTDDLGGIEGTWQDNTTSNRNANLYADAVELTVNAMALQSTLQTESGD